MKRKHHMGYLFATGALALAALGSHSIYAGNTLGAVTENLVETNVSDGFSELVSAIQPAVVSIVVKGDADQFPKEGLGGSRSPYPEEFFKRFFGEEFDMKNLEKHSGPAPQSRGVGSGFIIDSIGHVVTNYHVIEKATDIDITLNDGSTVGATLKGADPKTDLALLKIDQAGEYPYVRFGDSSEADIGDWVVALGNPFGLGGTATKGIISARGRSIGAGPLDDFIQIDAPINRGNSGGPLFNMKGEVIGVNSAIFSPNGGSVGIGFAIPSSMAEHVVAQLKDTGIVQRGFIGVNIQSVTKEIAESLGLKSAKGALVTEVVEKTPAEAAQIQSGDIILKFNDQEVAKMRDLPKIVAKTDIGENVDVVVWRDDAEKLLRLEVGESTDKVVTAKVDSGSESGKLGLKLSQLDDNYRSKLKINNKQKGVVVSGIKKGSIAAESGIRHGEIIKKVGKKSVSTPAQVDTAIAEAKKTKRSSVLMLVQNGEQSRFVAVPVDEKLG